MVWEQHCLLIVMTTRVTERGRVKCGQYWDPSENGICEFGHFTIKTISVEQNEEYTIASLELKNLKVMHFIYFRSKFSVDLYFSFPFIFID